METETEQKKKYPKMSEAATNRYRDSVEKFLPGNPGGPGPRPGRDKFLSAIHAGCSPEDVTEIVMVHVAKAKKGNPKSSEWLGKFVLPHLLPSVSTPSSPLVAFNFDSPIPTTSEIESALMDRLRQLNSEKAPDDDRKHPQNNLTENCDAFNQGGDIISASLSETADLISCPADRENRSETLAPSSI